MLAVVWLSVTASMAAEETWRVLRIDNLELVSNRSQRDLEQIHRDVYYFNRTMEFLFGQKYARSSEPISGLLLRNERDLREFVGDRAATLLGAYVGVPGFEIFLARGGSGQSEVQHTLFHELTHRNLNPGNPPLWFNEGIAELFETAKIRRRDVQIGAPNKNWVWYHTKAIRLYKIGWDEFFSVTSDSERYRNPDKSTDFYGMAWLLAHYCWFGKSELREKYLQLSLRPNVDDQVFEEVFGFGFKHMETLLAGYVSSLNYRPIEISLDRLDALPKPDVRMAEPALWKNYHARAYLVGDNKERARNLATAIPQGDPHRLMAVETLWALSGSEEDEKGRAAYQEEAHQLNSTNPLLRTVLIDQRLKDFRNSHPEVDQPSLPPELAGEMIAELVPALRLYRKNPHAVALAIQVMDLANAAVPEQLMHIFSVWETSYAESAKETAAALQRIRARQAPVSPPEVEA